MMVRIEAINNYCTLEMIKPTEVKRGLITLPGISNKTPRWGRVLSVGAGLPDLGGIIQKPDVEVGQLVYVMAHGQQEIHYNALGEDGNLRVASALDILVIMKDDETLQIQPLGSYIEIEKLDIAESQTGLVLPDNKRFPPNIGRVKSVGLGWMAADGTPIPFQVKVGDLVAFHSLRTMVVDFSTLGHDVQKTIIMHGDIIGIVKEEVEDATS